MKSLDKATVKLSNSLSNLINTLNTPSRLRTSAEITELMDITQSSEFFLRITKHYQSNDFHKICCMHMTLEEYSKGNSIYKLGEQGNSMYFVINGTLTLNLPQKLMNITAIPREYQQIVKALKNSAYIKEELERMDSVEKHVRNFFMDLLEKDSRLIEDTSECKGIDIIEIINPGESFGITGILTERLRSHNAIANEKVCLAVITRQNFKKIAVAYVEKKMNDRIDFLHNLYLFSTWSRISIAKLLENFETATYYRNQKVFKEDDSATFIIFIMSGEFKLTKSQVASKNLIKLNTFSGESAGTLPLRMGKVRKISKLSQIELVVKGKNQIIGLEDMSDTIKSRNYSCFCYSSRADVLILSRQVFLEKVNRPENFTYLSTRRTSESSWLDHRVKEIIRVNSNYKKKAVTPIHIKHSSLKIRNEEIGEVYKNRISVDDRAFTTNNTKREHKKNNDFKLKTWSVPPSPRKNEVRRLPPPNFLISFRKKRHSMTPDHFNQHHANKPSF